MSKEMYEAAGCGEYAKGLRRILAISAAHIDEIQGKIDKRTSFAIVLSVFLDQHHEIIGEYSSELSDLLGKVEHEIKQLNIIFDEFTEGYSWLQRRFERIECSTKCDGS